MLTANRLVAVLAPIISALAGAFCAVVADNFPGAPQLDVTEVTAIFVTVTTAGVALAWKWLEGWQKHEDREFAADAFPLPEEAPKK